MIFALQCRQALHPIPTLLPLCLQASNKIYLYSCISSWSCMNIATIRTWKLLMLGSDQVIYQLIQASPMHQTQSVWDVNLEKLRGSHTMEIMDPQQLDMIYLELGTVLNNWKLGIQGRYQQQEGFPPPNITNTVTFGWIITSSTFSKHFWLVHSCNQWFEAFI